MDKEKQALIEKLLREEHEAHWHISKKVSNLIEQYGIEEVLLGLITAGPGGEDGTHLSHAIEDAYDYDAIEEIEAYLTGIALYLRNKKGTKGPKEIWSH